MLLLLSNKKMDHLEERVTFCKYSGAQDLTAGAGVH